MVMIKTMVATTMAGGNNGRKQQCKQKWPEEITAGNKGGKKNFMTK